MSIRFVFNAGILMFGFQFFSFSLAGAFQIVFGDITSQFNSVIKSVLSTFTRLLYRRFKEVL